MNFIPSAIRAEDGDVVDIPVSKGDAVVFVQEAPQESKVRKDLGLCGCLKTFWFLFRLEAVVRIPNTE